MTDHSPADLRRIQAEDGGRPYDLAERLGVPRPRWSRRGSAMARPASTLCPAG